MAKRLTILDFVERANKIHGDKYDYSNSNYVSMRGLIKINCPIHGEFEQIAANHLKGCGCSGCGYGNREALKKYNTESEKCIDSNDVDITLMYVTEVLDTINTFHKKSRPYHITNKSSGSYTYTPHSVSKFPIDDIDLKQGRIYLTHRILFDALITGNVIFNYTSSREITNSDGDRVFVRKEREGNEIVDWSLISTNPSLTINLICEFSTQLDNKVIANHPAIITYLKHNLIDVKCDLYREGILHKFIQAGGDISIAMLSSDLIDAPDLNIDWDRYLISRIENKLQIYHGFYDKFENLFRDYVTENTDPNDIYVQSLPERFLFDGDKIIPELKYFNVLCYMYNHLLSDAFLEYIIESRLRTGIRSTLYHMISSTQLPSSTFIKKHSYIPASLDLPTTMVPNTNLDIISMFNAGFRKGKKITESMIDEYLDDIIETVYDKHGNIVKSPDIALFGALVHNFCSSNSMRRVYDQLQQTHQIKPNIAYDIKKNMVADIKVLLDRMIEGNDSITNTSNAIRMGGRVGQRRSIRNMRNMTIELNEMVDGTIQLIDESNNTSMIMTSHEAQQLQYTASDYDLNIPGFKYDNNVYRRVPNNTVYQLTDDGDRIPVTNYPKPIIGTKI